MLIGSLRYLSKKEKKDETKRIKIIDGYEMVGMFNCMPTESRILVVNLRIWKKCVRGSFVLVVLEFNNIAVETRNDVW